MIIFGSRMYGKKHVIQGVGACENCGAYGALQSYEGRRFGHVYFIPLFPMGSAVRVMKECGKCKMGRQVPVDRVRVLYARVEALMQPCILAATGGSRTFVDPQGGQETHNGPFLLDAIDMLYSSGHAAEVPDLLNMLDTDPSQYEHGLATGAMHELRGDAQSAYASYQEAMEAAPDEPLPCLLMADFCTRAGRHDDALSLLERAHALAPEDVQVLLAMAGPLELLGRFDELTALLDRAVAMAPQLEHDKPFSKLRKRFAKKAARG